MKRRLSLITHEVKDVANARHFYERLGWKAADNKSETAFFQENGMIFGLWGRNDSQLTVARLTTAGGGIASRKKSPRLPAST